MANIARVMVDTTPPCLPLVERIVGTDCDILISAYEKNTQKLDKEKIAMRENIAKTSKPVRGFDETFQTSMAFLATP